MSNVETVGNYLSWASNLVGKLLAGSPAHARKLHNTLDDRGDSMYIGLLKIIDR